MQDFIKSLNEYFIQSDFNIIYGAAIMIKIYVKTKINSEFGKEGKVEQL